MFSGFYTLILQTENLIILGRVIMVAKVGCLGGEYKFERVGDDFKISKSTPSDFFWKTHPVIITKDSRCVMGQMSEKDFSATFKILEDRSQSPSKLAGIKEDECGPVLQLIDRMHQEAVDRNKAYFNRAEKIDRKDLNFENQNLNKRVAEPCDVIAYKIYGIFLSVRSLFYEKKTIDCRAYALQMITFEHSKVMVWDYENIILFRCYTLIKEIKELKSCKEFFTIIKELQQLIQVFNVLFSDKSLPICDGIDVESYLLDLEKAVNLQAHACPRQWDKDKYRYKNKDLEELRAAELADRQAAALETPDAKQADLTNQLKTQLVTLQKQKDAELAQLQEKIENLEGKIDERELTEYFNGIRQALKLRTLNLTAANLAPMDQIDTAFDEVIKEMAEDGDSDKIITILTGLLGNLNAYPKTHAVIQKAIAKTKEIFGE